MRSCKECCEAKGTHNLKNLYEGKIMLYVLLSRTLRRGADKSLARPRRKEATATEDFEYHISYL